MEQRDAASNDLSNVLTHVRAEPEGLDPHRGPDDRRDPSP